jgi:hyperosmotically inducible protein
MKLIHSAFVVLVAAGSLAAPASAFAAPVPQANKVVTKSVEERASERLKADASLKKYDLSVSVENGVATLKGTVATAAQKLRAERDVKVTGVTKVNNMIAIDKDAGKGVGTETKEALDAAAAKTKAGTEKAIDKTKDATATAVDKTKAGTEKAVDKTKEVAKDAGHATKEAAEKTGEAITDAWITTKVKADYVNEDVLKGSEINVDTKDHVVTLKGTVKTAAGRDRAIAIAKTTKGVNRVVNQLVIK